MSYLTDADMESIVRQRLAAFAAERFQHEVNRRIAERIGDDGAMQQANAAIATLNVAIEEYEVELANVSGGSDA